MTKTAHPMVLKLQLIYDNLGKRIIDLRNTWKECARDPLGIEALRGLALRIRLLDDHRLTRGGRCEVTGCGLGLQRSPLGCSVHQAITWCDETDAQELWCYVIDKTRHLTWIGDDERTVRAWTTQCDEIAARAAAVITPREVASTTHNHDPAATTTAPIPAAEYRALCPGPDGDRSDGDRP